MSSPTFNMVNGGHSAMMINTQIKYCYTNVNAAGFLVVFFVSTVKHMTRAILYNTAFNVQSHNKLCNN